MPDPSRFLLSPQSIRPDNYVQLLVNGGQAYPAMLEAIDEARDNINLETYTFASDNTGWMFARALSDKARSGVRVNVILDGLGSVGCSRSLLDHLDQAGVRVIWYRPLVPWRRGWGWWRRDHKKILVVDGAVGFVGGLNIGDDYSSISSGGAGWRDSHARIQGPVVRQLQRAFLHTWNKLEGPSLDPSRYLSLPLPAGDAPAVILTNGLRRQRRQIRRAYMHALKRASRYIYVSNSYFVPDIGIRRRIRRVCKRGVDVRILLAGSSDVTLATYAARHLYDRLLRAGARVFEWRGPMMHAKTAVVDDEWATVGSCNLDMLSMRYNMETNVVVLGPRLAEPLRDQFRIDTASDESLEIRLADWRTRSRWQKLMETAAFSLRRWL